MPSKTQIPNGWRLARLGDVASLRTERVKPVGYDSQPYVALEHIVSGGSLTGYGKASDSVSYKTTFCKGDILYGKLRPNLRKVVRAEFDGVCSTEILAVRARDSADAYFLNHLLRSEQLHGYAMQGITGTKMPRTSWGHLRGFEILLPPLPEQRAIAAVLDSIDDAIEQTEAVIAATGQLRDSLLHQLLTHGVPGWHTEWREAPGLGTIPAGWEVVRLGEVAEVKGGKRLPKGASFADGDTGLPYIRVVDFHNRTVNTGDIRFLRPEIHKSISSYTISCTDVYISIAGTIGLVGTIPACLDGANLTENAAKIVIANLNKLSQHFMSSYLDSYNGQSQINHRVNALGQPKLALERVRTIEIPLPCLAEQQAIAAVLDGVDETIEHSRREIYMLKCLKESTANALLTGRVRVHSS